MKFTVLSFLSLFAVTMAFDDQVSSLVGHAGVLSSDEALSMANAMDDVSTNRQLVESNHTKMEVLIKNVDCAACMEAPPATRRRRLGGSDPFKSRILSPKEVFVTALNCDADDPYQIWNLISLEPTGIWYLFESAETGECMQVVGQCTPDGSLYNIEMGPCDATNSKAIWGFTGIGEVISYECFRSNWESDNLYHSTPDIFLEASCGNKGGVDRLDLSSNSADSIDQAENIWILYPKAFGTLPVP